MSQAIARLIVEQGLATAPQIREYLATACNGDPSRLPTALVASGLLQPVQLERVLDLAAGGDSAVTRENLATTVLRAPSAPAAPSEATPEIQAALADPKRRFGRYALLKEIGRGGMGIVYRAWDPQANRIVALKALALGTGGGEEEMRFEREARTAGKLKHSGIVRVHDSGRVEDRLYYAMDLLEGRSLAQMILEGPLPWRLVVRLASDCALAVYFAHIHGVIHRDIKPANIIVNASDRPVLVDFGLARSAIEDQSLTITGQVMGSPHYMSPEQIEGRVRDVDERSDVYSLGVVLFQALTRRPPFDGQDFGTLFDQIRRTRPTPPSKLAAQIPPELDRIALKCLEKKPADRYSNAFEFASDLRRTLRPDAPPVAFQELDLPAPVAADRASLDSLTGLFNRAQLFRQLKTNVPWEQPKGPVSLLLLDFDAFKLVNEASGRATGDMILTRFGSLLRQECGAQAIVGRHGGDSFLCVLPETSTPAALDLGERVISKAGSDPLVQGRRLTVSGGVAAFPDQARSMQDLVDAANRALFVSKKLGRGRISAAGQLDENVADGHDLMATLPCKPFVGRARELAAAVAHSAEICAGRPAMVFVQGESGLGKTRFLREHAKQAANAGILHLYVPCDEAKRNLPAFTLLRFVDLYFQDRTTSREVLRGRLKPPQRAALRESVPALAGWPAENERFSPEIVRQAVEAAMIQMLEESPLLLLLDNANHADTATLEILRSLLRRGKAPLGLAFAVKGDLKSLDPRRDGVLLALLSEFGAKSMSQIFLGPMEYEDIETLIKAVLPDATLPEEFVETISEASKGNPLYVELVLRLFMLTGRIKRENRTWRIEHIVYQDLPASLEAATQAVIKHLPPETLEALSNASVIGASFDARTLQAISGMKEGEMLDIVDSLEGLGLVLPGEGGRPTEFEFAAGFIRDVKYKAIPESLRRKLHGRVSQALVELPGIAGAGADFHAASGGGVATQAQGPATGKGPSFQLLRRARIPEAKKPLAEEGRDSAIKLLLSLANAMKTARLYPKPSKVYDEVRDKLFANTKELLAMAPIITYGAEEEGIKVNTEAIGGAADIQEAANAIFWDHLISSMTIRAGLTVREIDALLDGLSAPLQKEAVAPDHWDQYLDRKKIENFDLLQRRYLAQDASAALPHAVEEDAAERPLKPKEVTVLWEAMRHLKAAVDSRKLYPPGHKLVEESVLATAADFRRLLKVERSVTISAPENDIIVNGAALDDGGFQNVAQWIRAEFRRLEFNSMGFSEGINETEVRVLVGVHCAEPDAAMSPFAAGKLAHVVIDGRTYHRVTADTIKRTQGGGGGVAAPGAPAAGLAKETHYLYADGKDLNAAESAKALLKKPVAEFASKETERLLPALVGALGGAKETVKLGEDLVIRAGTCLHDPKPEIRTAAAAIVSRLLSEAPAPVKELVLRGLQPGFERALVAEKDAKLLSEMSEASRLWLNAAFGAKLYKPIVQLIGTVLDGRIDIFNVATGFKMASSATVKLFQAQFPNPIVDALSVPDAKLRRAAVRLAGMAGPNAVAPLVMIVSGGDDAQLRRIAASALGEIGRGWIELASSIKPGTSTAEIHRILEVFELTKPGDLTNVVNSALAMPDTSVKQAALQLLQRGRKLVRPATVRALLGTPDLDTQLAALGLAKDMKFAELMPDVVAFCRSTKDDTALRYACQYFKECPSPDALPAIRQIFDQGKRLFGVVKGLSGQTRAAAVEAALRIATPEAQKIIDLAAKDGDAMVRETTMRRPKPPG